MPVLIKITYCRNAEISNWFVLGPLWEGRIQRRETDLFGDTEFIASDGLFKTTNAGARNNWGYPV